MKGFYDRLKTMLEQEPSVRMAVSVEGEHPGMQVLWSDPEIWTSGDRELAEQWVAQLRDAVSGSCVQLENDRIFMQRYSAQPELVILGGGHISRELVSLGKQIGFRVTVVDDREEFASEERFPDADRVICGAYDQVFEKLPETPVGYYVVVTRGHLGDKECVRRILQRPFRYAGMIGSRRKVAQTKKDLKAEGFADSLLEQLHAPIGLDIGAVTPEEIAVSIAAELIQVKNRETVQVMDEKVLEALLKPEEKILAMIVEKKGSAPRGAGACMVITEKGAAAGTIGGGAIEYEAQKHGLTMLREKRETDLKAYQLNNIHSAGLGMICGGSNEIFFLRL